MWLQFFSQDLHFAINLLASLVCMAVFWLYFDAWRTNRKSKEMYRWIGFLIVASSYLLQATMIEQSVLGNSIFGSATENLNIIARLVGYAFIIYSLVIDPIQDVPKTSDFKAQVKNPVQSSHKRKVHVRQRALFGSSVIGLKWLLPFGSIAIALLYFRRATTGLERHLKPLAYSFGILAVADLAHLATAYRNTSNPSLYNLFKAFGVIWSVEQLLILLSALVLGRWVWSYLTKRIFTQLFLIFSSMVLGIFLVVSICLSALLIRSVNSSELSNLKTASQVLDYAIKSKQIESSSSAEQIASSSSIINAVSSADHSLLVATTNGYLLSKKQTNLIITDSSGQVLLRAEDTTKWGDSLSDDNLVKRALLGQAKSTTNIVNKVGADSVEVQSSAIIRSTGGQIIGSVISGIELDTAFVDGLQKSSGLQSSIYAGKVLSATTATGPDGKTRESGTQLTDLNVSKKVFAAGESYQGTLNMFSKQMFGSFLPLKDVDGSVVGALLIAEPSSTVLKTAGHSIEVTFIMCAGLLILSIIPVYLVSKKLTNQIG